MSFQNYIILTHATAWFNLEDIILHQISQLQKRYILYDYIYVRYMEPSNSWRQKVEGCIPGAVGRGNRELFNGDRVSV